MIAAFKGDTFALSTAHREIRSQFDANKQLTNDSEVKQKVADAHEASLFVMQNIIQATKSSCGTYEISPDQAHRMQPSGSAAGGTDNMKNS